MLSIKGGVLDIVTGASKTKERDQFAHFSAPYRKEKFALYIKKEDKKIHVFNTFGDIANTYFRLGVVRGYFYGKEFEDYKKNPKSAAKIEIVHSDEINYLKLLRGRVNGILADPYAITHYLKKKGMLNKVIKLPIELTTGEIHVMFSQKSVSSKFVKKFNDILKKLLNSSDFDEIKKKYLN